MSFVIKTSPFAVSPPIWVEERVMYGGGAIERGSEVFVWFSETAGGQGLAWRGYIQSIEPIRDDRVRLGIRPVQPSTLPLGISQMNPLRDVRDGSPQSELSRKLYYHSHNKVAAISDAEREFLVRHFA